MQSSLNGNLGQTTRSSRRRNWHLVSSAEMPPRVATATTTTNTAAGGNRLSQAGIYGCPRPIASVGRRGPILAIIVALLLLVALNQPEPLQAKTHHSKRQANNSPLQTPAATGRESTNWWNLWWQQYIDEAVQPTVRPIVGVSFDGKIIRLSDQNANRELSSTLEAANNRDQRDVESNFVLSNAPDSNQLELERNGRLREIASSLPNNMHPSLAAKQAMLVQRKSVQQQTNWQMIRPTIIRAQSAGRMGGEPRDSRTNRQANVFQPNEVDVGIQMRASMNRQQQPSTSNDFNQMPMEFEQQQNQMVDYSEDGEPDVSLDNSLNNLNGGQQATGGDSSSSSMMMNERPPEGKATSGDNVPSRAQQEISTRRPLAGMMPTKELPNEERRTTSGMQKTDGTRREQQLPVTNGSGRQQTGRTDQSNPQGGFSVDRQQPMTTITSTSAPSSTTKSPTQTSEVDLNETPISIGNDDQQPATPANRQTMNGRAQSGDSTPATGRVELQNGRPASGMGQQRQQQATTTSSRLPTIPGQSRPMMTTVVKTTTVGTSAPTEGPLTTTTTAFPFKSTTTVADNRESEQFTTTTVSSTSNTSNNQEAGGVTTTGDERQTTPNMMMPTSTSGNAQMNSPEPSDERLGAKTMKVSNKTEMEATKPTVESADGEEDGEEEADGNLLKTPGADGADESDDSSSESDDDDEDDQQEPKSTTMSSSSDTQKATTMSPEMVSKTTQQPSSMTTIELERLPPNEASTPARASTNKPDTTQFVMMTLKPSDREGGSEETITVPMDTLMKMMMNQVSMNETERLQTTTGASTTTTQSSSSANRTSVDTTKQRLIMKQINENKMMITESSKPAEDRATSSTGQTNQRGKSSKLQPPPTTKMPITSTSGSSKTTTNTSEEQSSLTPDQVDGSTGTTPRTMTFSVATGKETPISSKDGDSKIELLNLDLMPIRKMMSDSNQQRQQQQQQQQDRKESGGKKMVLMMQSPVGVKLQEPTAGTSGVSENEMRRQKMMEQVMVMNVEPGMRLRPPMMGSSQVQQQQEIQDTGNRAMSTAGPNQGNTVYMIMMNNGRQQPVLVSSKMNATAHSKKPTPMSTTSGPQTKPTTSAGFGESRQSSGSTTATKQSTISTMAQMSKAADAQTTSSMRGGSTRTTPAGLGSSTISQQQQQQSSVSMSSTTKTMAARTDPIQMSSVQTTGSGSLTSPLPTDSGEQTTTSRPMSTKENGRTMEKTMMKIDNEGDRVTFKVDEPNETSSTMGAITTTTPRGSSEETSGQTLSTTPSSLVTTTTTTPTFSTTTGVRRDQTVTGSMQITTSPSPMQSVSLSTIANNKQKQMQTGGGDQLGRLQEESSPSVPTPPRASGKRPQTKMGKPSNATSSFIPSKLRMDFSKTSRLQQQQANGTSVVEADRQQQGEDTRNLASGFAQNMAIRQFGGANRMSALANQPVPFGRPAAMTMQSQQQQQQQQSQGAPERIQRVEVPSFEYGPSIAVRRPDEPLANGQMPNCTLAGKNFCVLTKDYPMNEVRQAVERSFRSVRIMYEELQTVSDQELHKDDFNATNNQAASGKFACQTQVEMMRPGWAKDEITKEWMLVVNTDVFPQRVRTESCAQPNTPCEFIAPFYDSTCQQRYSLHRMIAIDPHDPSRSPQVAVFKFPAGCVCRVHPIKKSVSTPITSAM